MLISSLFIYYSIVEKSNFKHKILETVTHGYYHFASRSLRTNLFSQAFLRKKNSLRKKQSNTNKSNKALQSTRIGTNAQKFLLNEVKNERQHKKTSSFSRRSTQTMSRYEQFQFEYSEIVAIIRYTNLYYSEIIHWSNVGKKNVDFRIRFFLSGPYLSESVFVF